MAISLIKGQTIDLRKNDGGTEYDLSQVTIGLGWDVRKKETGFLPAAVRRRKKKMSTIWMR
jgi:tellurium resistance protein TerD